MQPGESSWFGSGMIRATFLLHVFCLSRTGHLRKDKFDEREADFYEALYTQSQAQFSAYVASGTVLNNYAHIFDLLIRLRQAVDHPYLVVHSATAPPKTGAISSSQMSRVLIPQAIKSYKTSLSDSQGQGGSKLGHCSTRDAD